MNRRLIALLCTALVGCAGDAAEDTDAAADTAAQAPAAAPAPAASTNGLVDPNTATRDQLVAVPGMTEAAADALIAARPFDTMLQVDSILSASALDEATRDNVYNALFKPIDLNTASGEEIMLIPMVGERMKHEFEEYRPYTDMGQFRREIGKYVDEAEVERLARYVMIAG